MTSGGRDCIPRDDKVKERAMMRRRTALLLAWTLLVPGPPAAVMAANTRGGSPTDCLIATGLSAGGSSSFAIAEDAPSGSRTAWGWGSNDNGQLGDGTTDARSRPIQVGGAADYRDFVSVNGGQTHSIGLTFAGIVWTWGSNTNGQLGDGTMTDRSTPVQVPGLVAATAVAAGASHSLALGASGTVWSWGDNSRGQLGHDSPNGPGRAARVAGLDNVLAIAAGEYHSLAVRREFNLFGEPRGVVWAWGDNTFGQLGDGTTTARPVPFRLNTGPFLDVKAIVAGSHHSLAVNDGGSVVAWGRNSDGQLGDGTTVDRLFAVRVSDPSRDISFAGIDAIAAGRAHSLALRDGEIWAWGDNAFGQLGDYRTVDRTIPFGIGLPVATAVAAGLDHSLALRGGGEVWTWGRNTSGQLGDGSRDTDPAPAHPNPRRAGCLVPALAWSLPHMTIAIDQSPVSGASPAVTASSDLVCSSSPWTGTTLTVTCTPPGAPPSYENVCATMTVDVASAMTGVRGEVACQGRYGAAATTDTTGAARSTDQSIVGLPAYYDGFPPATCTVRLPKKTTASWHVLCQVNSMTPVGAADVEVVELPPVVDCLAVSAVAAGGAVAVSSAHSLAIGHERFADEATAWSWGSNDAGQLGTGDFTYRQKPGPVEVPVEISEEFTDIVDVDAGLAHSIALTAAGDVWGWGENNFGQLGIGSTGWPRVPYRAVGISGVVSVAAGRYHTLAIRNDGTVWAWGANWNGQLGDGTLTERDRPVQVLVLTNVVSVAAGEGHSLAVRGDGTLWGWGSNYLSELGIPSPDFSAQPVQLPLTAVTAASAGGSSSFAVVDGNVWAWGENDYGQLGDGTTTDRPSPVQLSGVNDIDRIDSSAYHTLATSHGGRVWAWGINYEGQLGLGTQTEFEPPTEIAGLTAVTDISAGGEHSLAVRGRSELWAWGDNSNGQLGDGTTATSPIRIGCAQPALARLLPPARVVITYDSEIGTAPLITPSPGITCPATTPWDGEQLTVTCSAPEVGGFTTACGSASVTVTSVTTAGITGTVGCQGFTLMATTDALGTGAQSSPSADGFFPMTCTGRMPQGTTRWTVKCAVN